MGSSHRWLGIGLRDCTQRNGPPFRPPEGPPLRQSPLFALLWASRGILYRRAQGWAQWLHRFVCLAALETSTQPPPILHHAPGGDQRTTTNAASHDDQRPCGFSAFFCSCSYCCFNAPSFSASSCLFFLFIGPCRSPRRRQQPGSNRGILKKTTRRNREFWMASSPPRATSEPRPSAAYPEPEPGAPPSD